MKMNALNAAVLAVFKPGKKYTCNQVVAKIGLPDSYQGRVARVLTELQSNNILHADRAKQPIDGCLTLYMLPETGGYNAQQFDEVFPMAETNGMRGSEPPVLGS